MSKIEEPSLLEVKPLTHDLLPDAESIFDSSPETSHCSCMWFILAHGVKLGRESMVAVEPLFAACGFTVARQPSPTRVVMRRELQG